MGCQIVARKLSESRVRLEVLSWIFVIGFCRCDITMKANGYLTDLISKAWVVQH